MSLAGRDAYRDREPVDVRGERDFYRTLLNLGVTDQIEILLRRALSLIVELAGAQIGYLELCDERTRDPRWWLAHGHSGEQVDAIRSTLPRSVIAEALATGKTVLKAPAVLCAPVGSNPALGVVYLQDRFASGSFSADDRERAEMFARQLALLADQLLIRHRRAAEDDPTRQFRRALRVDTVFIGRSAAAAHVLRHVTLVAPLDVSVLLTGDSGTGKTQLAHLIHDNGPRADRPFVEVSCAALPAPLIESELFGALPGAHSTAVHRVEGKVAAAEGGTLFLDEIGELPLSAQSKLLQILHSKEYYPLGAPRSKRADIRVIAATNTDLKRAVANQTFREDLFYRLQVLPLRMPSLAERKEDIRDLLCFFCARAWKTHQLRELEISDSAVRAAEAAAWPGNLRELAHAIEAAAIRAAAQGAVTIERTHLFPDLELKETASSGPLTFKQATHLFQAQLLRRTLDETGWNIAEVATRMKIVRSHIYNLIRIYKLERDSGQTPRDPDQQG